MSEQPASVTRTCPICALPLPGDAHPNTKYCSTTCAYKAEYQQRVAKRPPVKPRKCKWCAEKFKPVGDRMIYCNKACQLAARNKRRREARAKRRCLECKAPLTSRNALRCRECAKEREKKLAAGRQKVRRKNTSSRRTKLLVAAKKVNSYDPREHDRRRRVTRADIDKWITSTGGGRLPADPLEALKVVLAENDDFREAFADVHGI